jgi:hypothetical protein
MQTRYTTNSIDVSGLGKGVYTLMIVNNGQTITKRFVKQ